ncbi:winged helix DNA-binding domain-containing protein [Actinomadura logoneensis]|uniref:Winged helix DNA-binding domain-containing protein n=1 Tax=Actinomadura logoneensis TaxID=2293572 RepID=A0A372JC35_9ACTN|nr:winged helix DNA-binding domain-containing protein [Actinomadura logoneensis]RFU37386.1 winged helix DNA-binding domain-containing protein [Actinomadura logoneensis]
METVTWAQALAWRMRRQHIETVTDASATEVVRRLAGVQAQVASAAELAVRLRRRDPERITGLIAEGALVKTWAMRGTLHLLPAADAPAYLALCGAARTWEKKSWQKNFGATPEDVEAIAEAARTALAPGTPLTREELTAAIIAETGSTHLADVLGSGWGMLLKPLAWMGVLCHGPSQGSRVTFTRPPWTSLPPVEDAARAVLRAFLAAHGPATPDTFDAWLLRKASRRKDVRAWFDAADLAQVDVEGTPMSVLPEHLDELLDTPPSTSVRLLGPFDQYILAGGTGSPHLVPPAHRADVSRTAGWISPVVLHRGRVAGVWDAANPTAAPTLFEPVPSQALAAELTRLHTLLS